MGLWFDLGLLITSAEAGVLMLPISIQPLSMTAIPPDNYVKPWQSSAANLFGL